jgi:hypothetical protein
MYMEKIEVPAETTDTLRAPAPAPSSPAAQIAGVAFVLLALPYWMCRAVGSFLWRDVARLGRMLAFAGKTYGEEFKRG